jgi:CopG family nickel-responsive transcriptional regulator
LANYKWRQGLGSKRLGVVAVVYEHGVRGLTDTLVDIQHENAGIIKAVQHLHTDAKNCFETLIVNGPAEDIRKLVDRLGALRGVKHAKLVVV